MDKKPIDKKEDKASRILTAIASMDIGEAISPSELARSINIHPNTLREKIDEFENAKEIGWRNIRDKKKKVRQILRTEEELILRTGLIEIKKDILDIKNSIEELKASNKKK